MRVGESEDDLRTAYIEADESRNNDYVTFVFDPIRESAGAIYRFSVGLAEAERGSRYSLWASQETEPLLGPYHERGKARAGTLAFKAYSFFRFRVANS